jgi:hypothetical protein
MIIQESELSGKVENTEFFFPEAGIYLLTLNYQMKDILHVCRQVYETGMVDFVEPNFFRLEVVGNALWPEQWNLKNEYISQNAPNPVNGSTVIRYSLPEGVTQAAIAVYSINGSAVKIIPLDAKTKSGSITLYASELAKGMYVYSLTANGVVLESRKMINP